MRPATDAFGQHAVQLGSQFAGPAAVSIYNAQLLAAAHERTEQMQQALESRAVIDQAIGIIRSRTGASAEWAFARLVRMSQTENTKLYVIAERLVAESVRRAQARRSQSSSELGHVSSKAGRELGSVINCRATSVR